MHIVLVYRYYNDGIVYYNLTFCTRKSLMTDLGLYLSSFSTQIFILYNDEKDSDFYSLSGGMCVS